MSSKAIWDKISVKVPLNLFCVGHVLLGVRHWSAAYVHSKTPFRKPEFPCKWLLIRHNFLVGDGSTCLILHLRAGPTMIWTPTGAMPSAIGSGFMCFSPPKFRMPHFHRVIHPLWLLHFFLLFWSVPWGERFDGDIPFKGEGFKVAHFLHNIWLSVSVFFLICHLLLGEASLMMAYQGINL